MATLGEQAVGSIVKLNVSGTARNFIVVHQGLPDATLYDSSCDGTWLLMQDIYTTMIYPNTNPSTSNDYAKSKVNAYLNADFFALLDANVRNATKQAKIPYRPGSGKGSDVASGADGLAVNVFLLAGRETGVSSSYLPVDGKTLEYFVGASHSTRIAYLNGTAASYWLRSPYTQYSNTAAQIKDTGALASTTASTSYQQGVRPALILPYNAIVTDGLVDGTLASTGAITGSVNINGVQRELTGKGYINIGGVLRDLSDSQANIGGILKSTKG